MILATCCLAYPMVWTAFGLENRIATPVDSIGLLSYQYYALLGFLAMVAMKLRREPIGQRRLPVPGPG